MPVGYGAGSEGDCVHCGHHVFMDERALRHVRRNGDCDVLCTACLAWFAEQVSDPYYECPWCDRRTYHPQDAEMRWCPCCGSRNLARTCEHRKRRGDEER